MLYFIYHGLSKKLDSNLNFCGLGGGIRTHVNTPVPKTGGFSHLPEPPDNLSARNRDRTCEPPDWQPGALPTELFSQRVERAGSALPVCLGHDLGHQLFRIQVQQVTQSGCKGPLLQHHARLFWRLVVLNAITPLTAGDQV